MREITLKDLADIHDYYTSESNYYSNNPAFDFPDWKSFYEEFSEADVDMNLVFRWDIFKNEEENTYSMLIVIIGQRKGIYQPNRIKSVSEEDVPQIIEYLKPHFEKLKKNWMPISEFFCS